MSDGMSGMADSHGIRWLLDAPWGLHSSYGYALFEPKRLSEKMRLIRGLWGAECEPSGARLARRPLHHDEPCGRPGPLPPCVRPPLPGGFPRPGYTATGCPSARPSLRHEKDR